DRVLAIDQVEDDGKETATEKPQDEASAVQAGMARCVGERGARNQRPEQEEEIADGPRLRRRTCAGDADREPHVKQRAPAHGCGQNKVLRIDHRDFSKTPLARAPAEPSGPQGAKAPFTCHPGNASGGRPRMMRPVPHSGRLRAWNSTLQEPVSRATRGVARSYECRP